MIFAFWFIIVRPYYYTRKQHNFLIEIEWCVCKGEVLKNTVHIDQDKVLCILKRAKCTEEEWDEYEEKVESEMDFEELLEDLGKVIEAANRLNMK